MTDPTRAAPNSDSRREGRRRILREAVRRVCHDWTSVGAALRHLTEAGSHALGVARVGVWAYDKEQTVLRCLDLFEGDAARHSGGTPLPLDPFPTYFRALSEALVIDVENAREDARTRDLGPGYLAAHGIGALLDVPIRLSGDLVGVLRHEHVGPERAWTVEEADFAVSMGALVSLVLEIRRGDESRRTLSARDELLSAIAGGAAGRVGADYFESVIRLIATHLGADLAFVGELTEDERAIRTLSAWRDGSPTENFEYPLDGSPCREVISGGRCVYRAGVGEVFPEDSGLAELRAEGYVAAPLRSADGLAMGLMVAVFRVPLTDTLLPESVLQIFAARASGEMERLRDEAHRGRLEAELLRAQRLESVGRLAGGIAHDFNNLLAPIQAYAEMGMETLPESHPIRGDLQEILDAARRAGQLTKQLLAFGRQQVLAKRTLDLNELVEAFRGMIRPVVREDIDFLLQLHGEPVGVFADAGQMEQVLMNLVVNAQHAMPEGGTLVVQTAHHAVGRDGDADYPDLGPGRYARLSVSDTGSGIDEETAAHLFEPFFTTKGESEGTGLGLATVYGIVQQHGGTVHFSSELGKGTRFDVFLPGREQRAVPRESSIPRMVMPGTERILVVEDEAAVRRLVLTVLRRSGYTVLEASGPAAALDMVEKEGVEFDLLLTDVVMPGMNGAQLYHRVAELKPGTKVLYMSGYAHEVIAGKGLDEAMNLLPKPFSVKDLTRRVRLVLEA